MNTTHLDTGSESTSSHMTEVLMDYAHGDPFPARDTCECGGADTGYEDTSDMTYGPRMDANDGGGPVFSTCFCCDSILCYSFGLTDEQALLDSLVLDPDEPSGFEAE